MIPGGHLPRPGAQARSRGPARPGGGPVGEGPSARRSRPAVGAGGLHGGAAQPGAAGGGGRGGAAGSGGRRLRSPAVHGIGELHAAPGEGWPPPLRRVRNGGGMGSLRPDASHGILVPHQARWAVHDKAVPERAALDELARAVGGKVEPPVVEVGRFLDGDEARVPSGLGWRRTGSARGKEKCFDSAWAAPLPGPIEPS